MSTATNWKCQTCGAEFPHIEHDEHVKRCSRCVAVEAQAGYIDRLKATIKTLEAAVEQDPHQTNLDELRVSINERLVVEVYRDGLAALHTTSVKVPLPEWLPARIEGELDRDDCRVAWSARLNSIDGHQALYDISQEG